MGTAPGFLDADLGLVAEPGRGVVRGHRTSGPAPGRRRLGVRAQQEGPGLRHRLERPVSPLRMDQDQHRDPQDTQPPNHFKYGPLDNPTLDPEVSPVINNLVS